MDLPLIQAKEKITILEYRAKTMKARIVGLEQQVLSERNRANSNSGHYGRVKALLELERAKNE